MVKRILVALFCTGLLLSFTGSVAAVEKKSKDDKAKETAKVTATKVEAAKDSTTRKSDGKTTAKDSPRNLQAKKSETRQFDTFVDQNGNGIDDRRENLKNKAVAESQAAKAKQGADAKKAEAKKSSTKKQPEAKKKDEKK